MAEDGSSSSSSSSSSSDSEARSKVLGSSSSSSSSSTSSSSSQGDSPTRKPAPLAREPPRRGRSRSGSPRVVKRKRESPVRHSRTYRDDSPSRRRRQSPSRRGGDREHHDREMSDRRRDYSLGDRQRRSRDDDRHGHHREEDPPRRGGRYDQEERQNGRRELPGPPPRSGDRDRHARQGRDRRSGFGEAPADPLPEEAPPMNGVAPAVEGKLHRSRANRWEPQQDAALPGPPGPPPGPPQREDRDWNHQTKEEAFPKEDKPPPEANFALSGKLAEESNTVNGVVLLHVEPPEARRPSVRWRLYIFKSGDLFGEPLPIHKQSCYFFGRERRVADVPTDHPSCSKQHAILQYRLTDKEVDGLTVSQVRPYIMDLGSTNGTYLNNERLDPERYYELLNKDLIRFGNSSREYVLLHEGALQEG